MDFGTIIGILVGLGLIGYAIFSGGGFSTFLNLPAILIVAGGTIAAIAIAFPTKELMGIFEVTKRVFNNPKTELKAIVRFILESSIVGRKQGNLALESLAKNSEWKPISKGLQLIADGADQGTIMEILMTELRNMQEQHAVGQKIFSEMGKFAPAFGMIGTLVGLVQMLSTLEDPSTIGPKMAVALLTTFYGALLANLLFLPMVTKLERRTKIESFQIKLMIVGLISINKGDTTGILKDKMGAFLMGEEPGEEGAGNKVKPAKDAKTKPEK